MAKFLLPLAVALAVIFWVTQLFAAAAIAGLAAVYLGSLYVHPNRDCVSCGGHKAHGPEGSANWRRCWTCKGKGYYPRLGVRLFRRDVIKGLAEGKHGRNW